MTQLELPIKIKVKHRGFWPDRIAKLSKKQLEACQGHDHGAIERGLAKEWEEENKPRPGINYGDGALQDLITSAAVHGKLPEWFRPEVTARDAALVADVIQWLGTNCGLGFLHAAFHRAGYKLHYIEQNTERRRWEKNRKRRLKREREREEKAKVLAERRSRGRRLELAD